MKVVESIRSLAGKVRSGFDVRDPIVLCGLAMTGYGLYLFRPWVSFAVCGVLLMAGGILMERKNGNR